MTIYHNDFLFPYFNDAVTQLIGDPLINVLKERDVNFHQWLIESNGKAETARFISESSGLSFPPSGSGLPT